MNDLPPSHDPEQLLLDLLDRPLAPEELQRLRAWVASGPEARELYLSFMSLHSLLHWRAAPAADDRWSVPAEFAPIDTPPLAPRLPGPFDRTRHPVQFWSSVCVLTTLVWLAFFVTLHPAQRAAPRRAAPAGKLGAAVRPVATLTSMADAQWPAAGAAFEAGAELRSGQSLELTHGLVELTFHRGAKLVLEGPAELMLLSEREVRLVHGRLVSRVPPAGDDEPRERFAVATPRFRVVDLGTEFGVEQAPDGGTEIYVFEGRVEARPFGPRPRGEVLPLAAGDSAVLLRTTSHVRRTDSPPRRFVRSLNRLGSTIASFTGGDPGEGLELEGPFLYAVNFNGPAIQVGGAHFQPAREVAGLTYSAELEYAWEDPVDLGQSSSDQGLAQVLDTLVFSERRHDPAGTGFVTATLQVEPGKRYRLQLLWYEKFREDRTFGIDFEGVPAARSFILPLNQGRAFLYEFIASDDQFEIALPYGVKGDPNPTLQALTLQEIAPAAPAPSPEPSGLRSR